MCENICLAIISRGNGSAWTHYANAVCSCFTLFSAITQTTWFGYKMSLNSMFLLHQNSHYNNCTKAIDNRDRLAITELGFLQLSEMKYKDIPHTRG